MATDGGPSFGTVGVGNSGANIQFVGFESGLSNPNLTSILLRPLSPTRNLMFGTAGSGIALTDYSLVPTLEASGSSTFSPPATYENSQKRYFADYSLGYFNCLSNPVRMPDIPPAITAWADSTRGPSTCDGSTFGQLGIAGMIPGQQYFLRYTIGGVTTGGIPSSNSTITADSNGRLLIQLIDSIGAYEVRIASLDILAGQTDTCWAITNITISAPTAPADPEEDPGSIVNICSNNTNVRIDLNPAGMGSWTADDVVLAFADAGLTIAAPTDTAAAADIYSPNVAPTSSGSYWFIVRNSTTRCLSDTLEVDFTVEPAPVLSCTGSIDGTRLITVEGFDPAKGSNYAVTVTPNNVVPGSEGFSAGVYTFQVTSAGNYTVSAIDMATGCSSNELESCAVIDIPAPDGGTVGVAKLQTTVCIDGVGSGNYRKVTNPLCTSNGYNGNPLSDFPVGRIRAPKTGASTGSVATDELVEMRGWVEFDLTDIPKEAVVDRIDYRAKTELQAILSPMKTCDVEMISATADVQFDVTQVSYDFYPRPAGFNDDAFEDLYETKYADITISRGATGSYTDLGTTAVFDVQNRIRYTDKKFQLGLHLSGKDFDAPVLQFHGMVFAKAADHQVCITYHLLDFGDLPESEGFDTDLAGNRKGPSHRVDPVNVSGLSALFGAPIMVPGLYLGLTPPDAEVNGLSSNQANGDDNDNSGDYKPIIISPSGDEDLSPTSFSESAIPDVLIAGDTVDFTTLVTNFLPRDRKSVV